MPRLTQSLPKYRKHRASGQAVVNLNGRDFYLGPYGTRASKAEYDRLTGEWLAAGRSLAALDTDVKLGLTVVELIAAYLKHLAATYPNHDQPGSEPSRIRPVLRTLKAHYGRTLVAEFGPLALKTVRQLFIDAGQCRSFVNDNTRRVVRVFRWGVAEELVRPETLHALQAVEGLRKGRSGAPEGRTVTSVDDAVVNQTLEHLGPIVADMVRLQRLTGCRPDEICRLRPRDVERVGDVWTYTPDGHKTEHHGHARVIFIGPQGQAIVAPYLLRDASSYCFSPREAEEQRRRAQHMARKTPIGQGNRPGTNRRKQPKRSPRERYDTNTYRRAIHRACDAAFPPPVPLGQREGETAAQWGARLTDGQRAELAAWQEGHRWSPNQLRHSAATEIRKRYGLEAAQVVLGHSTADTTQVYAERNAALASRVAREVG